MLLLRLHIYGWKCSIRFYIFFPPCDCVFRWHPEKYIVYEFIITASVLFKDPKCLIAKIEYWVYFWQLVEPWEVCVNQYKLFSASCVIYSQQISIPVDSVSFSFYVAKNNHRKNILGFALQMYINKIKKVVKHSGSHNYCANFPRYAWHAASQLRHRCLRVPSSSVKVHACVFVISEYEWQ